MFQGKCGQYQIRVQGGNRLFLKIAERPNHIHPLPEHFRYLLHAHIGECLVMGDDHDGPVLPDTVDPLAGSTQMQGNVAGFHLGYGSLQPVL